MTGLSQKQLVIELERVQTVRRRIPTRLGHCLDCREPADLVELADLARLFEVSVAEAVLQLQRRRIHMQHLDTGSIAVCAGSLLNRTEAGQAILNKSLPPSSAAALHLTNSSE